MLSFRQWLDPKTASAGGFTGSDDVTDFMDDYRQRPEPAGASCGADCPGNRIPLSPYEVARIAHGLRLSTGEVIRRYLQEDSRLLAVGDDGTCVFHRRDGCEVHEDRPISCRSFVEPADGTGRYFHRARQYRDVLRAWAAAASGRRESRGEGGPLADLGMWVLDVDAVVAERCRERGMSVPADLEARIDLHLEALRVQLE